MTSMVRMVFLINRDGSLITRNPGATILCLENCDALHPPLDHPCDSKVTNRAHVRQTNYRLKQSFAVSSPPKPLTRPHRWWSAHGRHY